MDDSSLLTTLPETNSSPLYMDPWKRRFLLETTIFRGKLLVLRECIILHGPAAGVWATCPEGHGLCVGIAGAPVCNVPWQSSNSEAFKTTKEHPKNIGS